MFQPLCIPLKTFSREQIFIKVAPLAIQLTDQCFRISRLDFNLILATMTDNYKDLLAVTREIEANLLVVTQEIKEDREYEMKVNNFERIQSACSWKAISDIFNQIPDESVFASGVACIPERFQSGISKHLDSSTCDKIKVILTKTQIDVRHDPHFILPIVATPETVKRLPSSAQQCFVCGLGFEDFQKILWKYCHRHTMHYGCLKKEIIKDKLPLYGPCGCDRTATRETEAHSLDQARENINAV
jgi:hypothetical protein